MSSYINCEHFTSPMKVAPGLRAEDLARRKRSSAGRRRPRCPSRPPRPMRSVSPSNAMPQVGALLGAPCASRASRFRLTVGSGWWFGNRPSISKNNSVGFAVQFLEQAVHHRSAGAVARIDHHVDAAREVELRGHLVHVRRQHIHAAFAACAAFRKSRRSIEARGSPGSLRHESCDCPHTILKPLYSGGLWLPGDHHAAVGPQMINRVVQQRRRRHANRRHVAAGCAQPAHDRIVQTRRAQPHVAPDAHPPAFVAAQESPQPAPQLLDARIGQFEIGQAADIVFAKNGRFEHNREADVPLPHHPASRLQGRAGE